MEGSSCSDERELVGRGTEGCVYVRSKQKSVIKVFHQKHGWEENFRELERFLTMHQYTDAVPKLVFIHFERGIIEMEFLKDYETLYEAKKSKKFHSREIVEHVIGAIVLAHLRLVPDDQFSYQDFGFTECSLHQTNIMVRMTPPVSVRFVEGGKRVKAPNVVRSGMVEATLRDFFPKRWKKIK